MNGNSNRLINTHFLLHRTDYGKVEPEPQEPDNIRAAIIVSILKDQITIMPVGGSMSLSCSGRLRSNNVSERLVYYYRLSFYDNTLCRILLWSTGPSKTVHCPTMLRSKEVSSSYTICKSQIPVSTSVGRSIIRPHVSTPTTSPS